MATISLALTDEQRALEKGVTEICKRYPGEYWRDLDARRDYPEKFVDELTRASYLVKGRKSSTPRARQSDLMLMLARTTPAEQVRRRTEGLSVFLIDIRGIKGLEIRPLRMMMTHSTNALFFDDMEIPADSLVGEEGKGFSYILSGMNAERILVASESIGDGRWFTEKAVAYSGGRVIFGKPIGANQGVQS